MDLFDIGHVVTAGLKFVSMTLLAFGWNGSDGKVIACFALVMIALILLSIALIFNCIPGVWDNIPPIINIVLVAVAGILTIPNIVMLGILGFNNGYISVYAAGFTYEMVGFFSCIALIVLIIMKSS